MRIVSSMLLAVGIGLLFSSIALAVPGWPVELRCDDVVIRFSKNTDEPAGVIVIKGRSYKFNGYVEDDRTLSCTYETADDDFDFTLRRKEDGRFAFKSGRLTRTLEASGEQIVPEDQEGIFPPPVPDFPEKQGSHVAPDRAMVYTPRTIRDSNSQLDVAVILVPRGWEVHSNIEWRPLNAFFVVNRSTVVDPAGGWALQYLPLDKLLCLPSAYRQAVEQGDLLTASGMELCEAVPSAGQFAKEVLIARYRNIPGMRIVRTEDLPEVARVLRESSAAQIQASARNGYSHHFDAARVRIAYRDPDSNVEMEEDVYCMLEITWSEANNQMAVQSGMPDTQTWIIQPVRVFSFIAPRGRLEQAASVLQTIVSSGQITLRWSAYTSAIASEIRRINTRDLAAMAATQAQITDIQRATWREMTERQNKINLNTGIQLTGNQVYADPRHPDGPKYVLDLNYTHYINDDGSVFSSPDSTTTPPGSGWHRMETVYPD